MTDTRTVEALERIADTLDDLVDIALDLPASLVSADISHSISTRRAERTDRRVRFLESLHRMADES